MLTNVLIVLLHGSSSIFMAGEIHLSFARWTSILIKTHAHLQHSKWREEVDHVLLLACVWQASHSDTVSRGWRSTHTNTVLPTPTTGKPSPRGVGLSYGWVAYEVGVFPMWGVGVWRGPRIISWVFIIT